MGVQGPDNIPQRDSISVNRNGEVSTNRAEQFKENARNMFIEAFAKLKTLGKPETEAEARENAMKDLSMDEKLSLLNKIAEQMKERDPISDNKVFILLDEFYLAILRQELERIISSGQDVPSGTDEINKQIAEIEAKLNEAKIKQETYEAQMKLLQQEVKVFPPQVLE